MTSDPKIIFFTNLVQVNVLTLKNQLTIIRINIKDLAEPSKRLADDLNRQVKREEERTTDEEAAERNAENDEKLIDIEQKDALLLDLGSSEAEEAQRTAEDEVNELIDLMTLTESNILNEQLKELEKLEQEKRQRDNSNALNRVQDASAFLLYKTPFDFINSTFASKSSSQSANLISQNLFETTSSTAAASASAGGGGAFKSFTALMSKASDDFEKEWQSAFGSATSISARHEESNSNFASVSESPSGTKSDTTSFFSSPSHDSLFSAQLIKNSGTDLFDAGSLNLFASSSSNQASGVGEQSKATSQAAAKTDQSKVIKFILEIKGILKSSFCFLE